MLNHNIMNDSLNQILYSNRNQEASCMSFKNAHEKLLTDLKTFSESLEPSILVPVCNRVLMRGNLIHTNEILVSLGCGYFTKCTSATAQEICQQRIKGANTILQNLEKEKEFVESQLNFSNENIFSSNLQEIIEEYDENTEEEWKVKHALKMKEFRKSDNRDRNLIDHNDIMQKLELLELQEEIDNLYANDKSNEDEKKIVIPETDVMIKKNNNLSKDTIPLDSKEFTLRKKLAELRQRKKSKCVTEDDVMRRLNELEEEEEIEDELDRLYDTMYGNAVSREDSTSSDDDSEIQEKDEITPINTNDTNLLNVNTNKSKKVSFGTDSNMEIETITINFSHSSDSSPVINSSQNLKSPSDIYKVFPENFKKDCNKSIIKNCHRVKDEIHNVNDDINTYEQNDRHDIIYNNSVMKHIALGNVIEHITLDNDELVKQKPIIKSQHISKFKSMRMAKKNSKN